MMELNKIINGDCSEILKNFPDKYFDFCLTDAPYGRNIEYDNYVDTEENLKELIKKSITEILRVSKTVFITVGTHNVSLYPKSDWILAWVYPGGGSHCYYGFSCWQPILAYGKDPYQMIRKPHPDIIITKKMPEIGNFDHPCPKDIHDWRRIFLRGSTNKNDIILDPFCGSGTTLQIAKETGRSYVGIDISKKYCKISEERLEKTKVIYKKSLFED